MSVLVPGAAAGRCRGSWDPFPSWEHLSEAGSSKRDRPFLTLHQFAPAGKKSPLLTPIKSPKHTLSWDRAELRDRAGWSAEQTSPNPLVPGPNITIISTILCSTKRLIMALAKGL